MLIKNGRLENITRRYPISSVLSDEYARFVQPIREGLVVFLQGLPVQHQEEILVRQATLPVSASISERLALLARCCPVLHKLGQILRAIQRLAPELREHLRELETFPSTIGEDAIRGILAQELGPLELRGLRLTPPAIAEASVAVVVPFERVTRSRRESTNDVEHPRGVFKVLKPGIEERLELELGAINCELACIWTNGAMSWVFRIWITKMRLSRFATGCIAKFG